jgi:hypothetical protein
MLELKQHILGSAGTPSIDSTAGLALGTGTGCLLELALTIYRPNRNRMLAKTGTLLNPRPLKCWNRNRMLAGT